MRLTFPVIQIRSHSLILYDQIDSTSNYSSKLSLFRSNNLKEQREAQYKGELTTGAKKRLTKAIDLMCQASKWKKVKSCITGRWINHRLSFITLTISSQDNITAQQGYDKVFKHFLQWLRRTAKVTTYVWKAEFQERGQLHYHITTPSYIDYRIIRTKWNVLQKQAGWLKQYHEEHGHYDPNSTDIHAVKKRDWIIPYIIKEFIKSIQNQPTVGKVWDCSLNLKKMKYYSFLESQHHNILISELIERKLVEVVKLDQCHVIKLKKQSVTSAMHLKNIQEYEQFLEIIRSYRKDT